MPRAARFANLREEHPITLSKRYLAERNLEYDHVMRRYGAILLLYRPSRVHYLVQLCLFTIPLASLAVVGQNEKIHENGPLYGIDAPTSLLILLGKPSLAQALLESLGCAWSAASRSCGKGLEGLGVWLCAHSLGVASHDSGTHEPTAVVATRRLRWSEHGLCTKLLLAVAWVLALAMILFWVWVWVEPLMRHGRVV